MDYLGPCPEMGLGSFGNTGVRGAAWWIGRGLAAAGTGSGWGELVAREGSLAFRDMAPATRVHHRDVQIPVS